ncbi:MAG: carboxylic ester hydrolase [Anaerolineales bacterium]
MRLLEILISLTLLLRSLYPRRWNLLLPTLILLFHLLIEGYRWQMVPLYAFALLEFLLSFRGALHPAQSNSVWKSLLKSGLLLVCIAPPALFPIPQIAPPTGPYTVGTTTIHLTDPTRSDPYAPDPTALRELLIQIWYPTDALGETPAPWMTHIEIVAPAISAWIEMPSFFLDHLKYSTTRSYADMPISNTQARYPVLIFSHGFGGFRAQNTFQMQDLASHGYIVVAPEHTYASVITVFPDGRVANHNPATLPDGVSEAEYDRAAQRLVEQWTADLRFVLDTLAMMDQMEPLLRGRLDLERVGVLGHSTGGGATVQICATDSRCKAGLGMDAWLVPVADEVIANGPQQPFLFLYSEQWPKPKNMALFQRVFETMNHPVARFTIKGTSHYDFTDLPALSPLAPYIGLKGPLNANRVQAIIMAYSLAFFDAELKGQGNGGWQRGLEGFPEVIFVEGK